MQVRNGHHQKDSSSSRPRIFSFPHVSVLLRQWVREETKAEKKGRPRWGSGAADTHSEGTGKEMYVPSSPPTLSILATRHALGLWTQCGHTSVSRHLWVSASHASPMSHWTVPTHVTSRVRPLSEDIPAADLLPNGSLMRVWSSLKRPVTAIKESLLPSISPMAPTSCGH